LVTRLVQSLIWITSPVSEQQQVPSSHRSDAPQQLGEIWHAVYQNRDMVAGRPGEAIGVTAIQPGRRITSLIRRQEPLVDAHDIHPRQQPALAGSPLNGLAVPLGEVPGLLTRNTGSTSFLLVQNAEREPILAAGGAGLGADATYEGAADLAVLMLPEEILQLAVPLGLGG
jgi:hypothetical protein